MRVTPPVGLRAPRRVFIADHGRHSSLLLPRADGRVAEFAYGEWEWFALGHDQWFRAGLAMLWPTRGTLGMAVFDGPAEIKALRARWPASRIHELNVERAAADALLQRLQDDFDRHRDQSVYNSELEMDFVPAEAGYSMVHECNSAVADWLRELGCRVVGCPLSADFTVRDNH